MTGAWVLVSVLNIETVPLFLRTWADSALGRRLICIDIAYRYFDMDYSKGSGSNEFGFDGSMDGVMIGLTWRN